MHSCVRRLLYLDKTRTPRTNPWYLGVMAVGWLARPPIVSVLHIAHKPYRAVGGGVGFRSGCKHDPPGLLSTQISRYRGLTVRVRVQEPPQYNALQRLVIRLPQYSYSYQGESSYELSRDGTQVQYSQVLVLVLVLCIGVRSGLRQGISLPLIVLPVYYTHKQRG